MDVKAVWCEVVQDLNEQFWLKGLWVIKLDKVTVNGTLVYSNQLALIDTGTAFVLAADANMKKFVQQLQGKVTSDGAHFFYDEKSLSVVSFEFAGGVLDFESANFFTGGGSTARVGCVTKAPSIVSSNVWILGEISSICIVPIFDYEQNRVGFANLPDRDLDGFGMRV